MSPTPPLTQFIGRGVRALGALKGRVLAGTFHQSNSGPATTSPHSKSKASDPPATTPLKTNPTPSARPSPGG
jgi:hypothetical protein